MHSHVTSILLYAWESWTLTARATMKNTSYGNKVLPQDTTHLIRRSCFQRGSLCQNPTGNRTIRRPPDHSKETQTEVVWTCLPFISCGQNHIPRIKAERKWEEDKAETEKEVGRQHQAMDRPGVRYVPGGNWL